MPENTDQKDSAYGHFSRSDCLCQIDKTLSLCQLKYPEKSQDRIQKNPLSHTAQKMKFSIKDFFSGAVLDVTFVQCWMFDRVVSTPLTIALLSEFP